MMDGLTYEGYYCIVTPFSAATRFIYRLVKKGSMVEACPVL